MKTLHCIWCKEKSIISKTAKVYQCDECYAKVVEKRMKDDYNQEYLFRKPSTSNKGF